MTEPSDSGTPETDALLDKMEKMLPTSCAILLTTHACKLEKRLIAAQAELAELRSALTESVCLQSHYASLLNQYDGGGSNG